MDTFFVRTRNRGHLGGGFVGVVKVLDDKGYLSGGMFLKRGSKGSSTRTMLGLNEGTGVKTLRQRSFH